MASYDYTKFQFKLELPEGADRTVDRALNLVQRHLDWDGINHIGKPDAPFPALEDAFTFHKADLLPDWEVPAIKEAGELAIAIARNIGSVESKTPLTTVLTDYEPSGLIVFNDTEAADIDAVVRFAQAVQNHYGLEPLAVEWAHVRAGSPPEGGAAWLEKGKETQWNKTREWVDERKWEHENAQKQAAAPEAGM